MSCKFSAGLGFGLRALFGLLCPLLGLETGLSLRSTGSFGLLRPLLGLGSAFSLCSTGRLGLLDGGQPFARDGIFQHHLPVLQAVM